MNDEISYPEMARQQFAETHKAWQEVCASVPATQLKQLAEHQSVETERQAKLAAARADYEKHCSFLQTEVDKANEELNTQLAALNRGDSKAVSN